MKNNFRVKALCLLFLPGYLAAQVPVVGTNVEINPLQLSDYGIANMDGGAPWVTPISQAGNGWRSNYFSTSYTTKFQTMSSMADESLSNIDLFANGGDAAIVSAPLSWWYGDPHGDPNSSDDHYFLPSQMTDPTLQFRRNYNGICSAHEITDPIQGNVILAFSHNENKNEFVYPNHYYQNTICSAENLDPSNPLTFSGTVGGVYRDDWSAYFAFTCMQWIQNTGSTTDISVGTDFGNRYFWEQGPIAWPPLGYLSSNTSSPVVSHGNQSPSSIIANGYVYVYFIERSGVAGAPSAAIKVVRAKLADALNPSKYFAYCNGSWYPSMPAGVTGANMLSHLQDPGPASTALFPSSGYSQFTVAHLTGTNIYLGMEWAIEGPANAQVSNVYFRSSTDLVHWSARSAATLPAGQSYSQTHFQGPLFLSADGMSNIEIDPNHFYMIGVGPSDHVIYRRRMTVSVPYNVVIAGGGLKAPVMNSSTENNEPGNIQMRINAKQITVSFPSDMAPVQKVLHIYDMLGKMIKEEVIPADNDNFAMDFSDITRPGMYIFMMENGGEIHHLKFMVN
jgi:hypothetical protein